MTNESKTIAATAAAAGFLIVTPVSRMAKSHDSRATCVCVYVYVRSRMPEGSEA